MNKMVILIVSVIVLLIIVFLFNTNLIAPNKTNQNNNSIFTNNSGLVDQNKYSPTEENNSGLPDTNTNSPTIDSNANNGIIADTNTTSLGGGSGGSGGGSSASGGNNEEVKKCVESWACGGWSFCGTGTQVRTCVDESKCGTDLSKPIETQTCIPQGPCNLEIARSIADACITTTIGVWCDYYYGFKEPAFQFSGETDSKYTFDYCVKRNDSGVIRGYQVDFGVDKNECSIVPGSWSSSSDCPA